MQAEQITDQAAGHPVADIEQRTDDDEQRPQDQHLAGDRASIRLDELREERQEEQRDLRIGDPDREALAPASPRSSRHRRRSCQPPPPAILPH